ncbi:TPA: hypothetical protein ACP3ZG_001602 [Pseudomonas aeruginosa]|uniref:Uncharacterized protein n=1 Tax=Pseudomonas aeruginosa TaxID=287 RepID=A0A241XS53_PSEAI|nr:MULTISPECIES: hypothetical protein [Pseudomonas]ELG7182110.1 hypothetical protein [Pseudomonas aeruginosa]MBH4094967.1 hypothetical protein [Pseudomonas aeruginosa]MBI6603316.1 hypothetical protein [Pseudomonas sp. S4_EA_1b]MBI8852511.1 hypothetical protein [Pseudomonas aeruginosa]OBY57587.1 hypothetical protein A9513_002890 [Pseudomonas sp. AU12215]
METFNGKPLPSELRRLARKSIGDCASVMVLAAEALENGTAPEFKGRPLVGALQSLSTRNMGDAKAAMQVAAGSLSGELKVPSAKAQ